jgi:probable phosphoglycerate mutase
VPRRADLGFLEIGQGEWEGRSGEEIQARWPDVIAGWRRDPLTTWAPGGESVAAVDVRVRTALGRLVGDLAGLGRPAHGHRSQVLGYGDARSHDPWSIVVGHDGALKVALLALLDLPLDAFWRFPFALCGISIVEIRAGRPRLRAHNLTDHLGTLGEEQAQAAEAERDRSGAL